jgi:anti-anti-sigma factor
MRAHQQAAPLVVVRSETRSGRVGLRLIGELDLNTVGVLEAELSRTREQSPPSVIDLSELRFLDLVGLRVLLRCVEGGVAGTTRLVGATGIVRRLINLSRSLDDPAADAPFPAEGALRLAAHQQDQAPTDLHESSASGCADRAASRFPRTKGQHEEPVSDS